MAGKDPRGTNKGAKGEDKKKAEKKDWEKERKQAQKFKGADDGLADQKRYDW